jgi:hypothetical protein
MTQRWYLRAVLAAVIGLGVAASLARAQAPAPAAAPPPNPEPWAVIEFGAGTPLSPAFPEPPKPPAPSKGPVRDWVHARTQAVTDCVHGGMNAHGVGCWSHHNSYTCGSLKSELTFVFGSCREFFGEPCLPGPPQPPMPPGYGPPPSYLPQPGYAMPPGYGTPGGQTSGGASAYGRRSGCPSCQ